MNEIKWSTMNVYSDKQFILLQLFPSKIIIILLKRQLVAMVINMASLKAFGLEKNILIDCILKAFFKTKVNNIVLQCIVN
ncbi:unnamed protein product [Heterobilharzia americana]|nr:unnamed protein product [Heterobilharzia americana]